MNFSLVDDSSMGGSIPEVSFIGKREVMIFSLPIVILTSGCLGMK